MENKLTYIKVGDNYIPNLTIKPSPPIGKYGRMRRDYLRDYVSAIRKVNQMTKKPIILAEFGFISAGEPKSEADRAEILARYGYESEAAAIADIENFVAKLPDALKAHIYEEYPDPATWGNAVFQDMDKFLRLSQRNNHGYFPYARGSG